MRFRTRKSKRDSRCYISFNRLQAEKPKDTGKSYSKDVKDPGFIKSVRIIAKSLQDFKSEAWSDKVMAKIRKFAIKMLGRDSDGP